jgi:hypothetical protein
MSFVLLGIYCANVIVTIFTHEGGTDLPRDEMITDDHPDEPLWKGFLKLAISAGFLAVVSEVMSDALTPTARMLGLSDTFSGLVLLGGMGTLGEILASSHFARQGRPSLVLSSARRSLAGIPWPGARPADGPDVYVLRSRVDRAGFNGGQGTDPGRARHLVRGPVAAGRLRDPRDRILSLAWLMIAFRGPHFNTPPRRRIQHVCLQQFAT